MRNTFKLICQSSSIRFAPALVLALLLQTQSGVAQLGKPQFRSMPKLTQSDLGILRKLVREDLATKPIATTLAWNNAESSNSGTVTLVDRFVSSGRNCLRVKYEILPGVKATQSEKPNTYLLNNCRSADGSWHVDSSARPDNAQR